MGKEEAPELRQSSHTAITGKPNQKAVFLSFTQVSSPNTASPGPSLPIKS
jgi:hypothetical protein